MTDGVMPILTLMMWALDELDDLPIPGRADRFDLAGAAAKLARLPYVRAMEFLGLRGEDVSMLPEELEGTPEEAGSAAVDQLVGRLIDQTDWEP